MVCAVFVSKLYGQLKYPLSWDKVSPENWEGISIE